MTHERAQELLRKAGEVLTACQQDFESGRPVNVVPMERVVMEFCGIIQKMPRDEAQLYEEPLHVMVEGLEALETLLTQKRDVLKGQVQTLNTTQQAQAAYKKFPSTPEGN